MRPNPRRLVCLALLWASASFACAKLPAQGMPTSQDAAADVPTAPSSTTGVAQGNLLLPNRSGYFAGDDANPLAITAIDINHDALPDIAIATWNSNAVWTMINRGHGRFDLGVRSLVAAQPRALLATDFTHDGNPDLVVATLATKSITSYVGDGNGGFASPSLLFQSLNNGSFLAANYLNQDSLLDLA